MATLSLPAGVPACLARPCLFVARHPSQGSPRGRSHARCRERLPGLMGPGRLHLGASGPGIAWGSCSPTQPSSRPPLVAGGIWSSARRLWASLGGGQGGWRGSTRGGPPHRQVSGPPLAGQPPQRLQAAGGGHVPADISAPRAPASCSLGAQRLPESILHQPSAGRKDACRSEGLPPAPLLTLGPCGLAPPWGLPLAMTLEAPRLPPRPSLDTAGQLGYTPSLHPRSLCLRHVTWWILPGGVHVFSDLRLGPSASQAGRGQPLARSWAL